MTGHRFAKNFLRRSRKTWPLALRNWLSGRCTTGIYSGQFHEVDCVRGRSKAFYTQTVLFQNGWWWGSRVTSGKPTVIPQFIPAHTIWIGQYTQKRHLLTFFLFRWWMLRLSRWRLHCRSLTNNKKRWHLQFICCILLHSGAKKKKN